MRVGTLLERFPRLSLLLEQRRREQESKNRADSKLDSIEARIRKLEAGIRDMRERERKLRLRLARAEERGLPESRQPRDSQPLVSLDELAEMLGMEAGL